MFTFRLFPKEYNQIRDYFASPPALQTDRLILRMARIQDADDIFQYSQDPDVARYVLWERHTSRRDSKDYIRYLKSQYRNSLPSSYVIVLKETGHVIGTIGFMSYAEDHSCVEVGYSLSKLYWNQNIATEALSCIIHYAFDSLKLNRIEAMHDVDNPSSGRVMQKCGMLFEGTLRQKVLNKGQYRDVNLYAILRKDWEQQHQS